MKNFKKAIKGANKGKMSKVTVEEISLAELNKIDGALNEGVSIKVKPTKAGFKVVFVEGVLEAETLSKKDLKALTKSIKKEKKGTVVVLKDTVALASLNALLEEFDEIAKIKLVIEEGENVLKIKFNYSVEETEEEGDEEETVVAAPIVVQHSDGGSSTCTGNCGSCDCEDEDEEGDDDEDVIVLPTETVEQPSKKDKKKNKNKKKKNRR